MREVLKFRIDACGKMASRREFMLSSAPWFSFTRGGGIYERWGPGNVPVMSSAAGAQAPWLHTYLLQKSAPDRMGRRPVNRIPCCACCGSSAGGYAPISSATDRHDA
jgi:hypothetical protein